MTDLMRELEAVFRAVFEDPTLELRDELTAADVLGWDSLNHVNLLAAIEDHFRIRFKPSEVRSYPDVGALRRAVEQKIAAGG